MSATFMFGVKIGGIFVDLVVWPASSLPAILHGLHESIIFRFLGVRSDQIFFQ